MMPEKILTCLTCPAITAWVTPAAFRILMHVPSWPSETQWRSAPASRAAASSSGNASSLMATTVTSWPRLRAPWSTRKGNRPLPAIRPILGITGWPVVIDGLADCGRCHRTADSGHERQSIRTVRGLGIAPLQIHGSSPHYSERKCDRLCCLSRAALLALALSGRPATTTPTITVPTPNPVTEDIQGHADAERRDHATASIAADRRAGRPPTLTAHRPGAISSSALSSGRGTARAARSSSRTTRARLASVLQATTPVGRPAYASRLHDPNGTLVDKSFTYTVKVTHPRYRYSSTTSSSRRLGRRRPTPRLDERMKFDEVLHFGAAERRVALDLRERAAGVRVQQVAERASSLAMESGENPRRIRPMVLRP